MIFEKVWNNCKLHIDASQFKLMLRNELNQVLSSLIFLKTILSLDFIRKILQSDQDDLE